MTEKDNTHEKKKNKIKITLVVWLEVENQAGKETLLTFCKWGSSPNCVHSDGGSDVACMIISHTCSMLTEEAEKHTRPCRRDSSDEENQPPTDQHEDTFLQQPPVGVY